MSFEMNSIKYDSARKSGISQSFKASDGNNIKKVFMPVPYNIGFELNIMAKLKQKPEKWLILKRTLNGKETKLRVPWSKWEEN